MLNALKGLKHKPGVPNLSVPIVTAGILRQGDGHNCKMATTGSGVTHINEVTLQRFR